jgi:hypothetical protein
MLVYLGFEVAPERKPHVVRSGDVTTQGNNMPKKHFSENSERTTRFVGRCTILLKHIFCSMLLEKIIQVL